MLEVTIVGELGNFSLENKKVYWKGKEYIFANYYNDIDYDGDVYVMLDENDEEIGRIKCKSDIVVLWSTERGIEILEVEERIE